MLFLNDSGGIALFDELGLMMIMMYPIVPIFLIELNLEINFWRRIGVWTYGIVFLEWLPIGFTIYVIQDVFLFYQTEFSTPFVILGLVLIALAIILHGWTAKLIGFRATIGYTELKPDTQPGKRHLVTSGPFSVVRHPSYWAHIAIDVGLYLITGIVALGVIAVIDLIIIDFFVTRLEDNELVDRFGERYRDYQKSKPRFFPKIF